ncbi:MAG: ATP-grasp domain-containing protein, partial [Gammaproteobacteria bacterium]|nr:ATP-grasp domain-containing protein [Gammaproteobacteria bacterium]
THSTPVTYDMMYLLQDRGVQAVPIIPEHDVIDLANIKVDCDLYVLRPSAEIILSLAAVLYSRGAKILNNLHSCTVVRDKIQVAGRMLDAGLPFPKSYVTGNIEAMRKEISAPVIVKPERGALGEGIQIFNENDPTPPVRKGGYFAQHYLPTDHYDLKVYVIGKEVMARKRHFPCENDFEYLGTDSDVSEEVRELALKCGEIFDLDIYGLDIVQTKQGLYIVDVNYFPSFLGVPDAAEKLADYIYNYALRNNPNKPKIIKW